MAQDDTITQQADATGSPPAVAAGEAGRQLGPIRLIRRIGRGGMGEVWLARHELLGRDVAVKILSTEVMGQADPAFKGFIQGAKVAASLGHPGLNKVHHADVADGVPYLVLELLDGPNLSEFISHSGRLDLPTVRAVIEAVGEAVAELHRHDLVHRDIKPSNVVLTTDGRIVVTDFGLACARPVSALRGNSGFTAGSPPYMAPEMFDGIVSARTDVYAIGMTAYQLLCGRLAFEGTLDEVQRQHLSAAIDVAPLRAAGVPEGVIDVVVRAASKEILFRPKTARHVLDAFRAACDEAGIRPASSAALARLLTDRAASSPDQTHAGAAPAGNTAETLARFAARKRNLRDSGHLRGPPQPAPVRALAVPLAVQQVVFSEPQRGRPALITAIGVMSIVVASLSFLCSSITGFQSVGLLVASRMPALAPKTTTTSGPGSFTITSGPGIAQPAPSAPTTSPSTVPSTGLTPADIQMVVSKVQSKLGANKLNAAQVSALVSDLKNPSQNLVTPGTAQSPVRSAQLDRFGTATLSLTGGMIQIDSGGTVVSRYSYTMASGQFPRINPAICIAGIIDGIVSTGLAVLLLVAGIGALRTSRWAPRAHRIYAWGKIPLAIVGGLAFAWIETRFISLVPGSTANGNAIFGFYAAVMVVLGCAYPIGLLIALRSKTVRGYYQSIRRA